jgi:hypothetical protein
MTQSRSDRSILGDRRPETSQFSLTAAASPLRFSLFAIKNSTSMLGTDDGHDSRSTF